MHPFDYLDYVDVQHHTGHCWLSWRRSGEPEFQSRRSFYESFFTSTILNAEGNKAPSFREFAYHLDATAFGEFLRSTAPRVRHVLDDVLEVQLDEQGRVASLHTRENGDFRADIYLDCTGFRRQIISRVAPDQKFQSYASSLFCDRAVVIRMPYRHLDDKEKLIHPYVKASARSAGWIWSIPLYSRMSSGYVYSSSFLSDDAAERELRAYWRLDANEAVETLKVRFETGKLPLTWVKNCIAIGLAGGFIEPLESTGLAITQLGLEMAASMLDAHYYDQGDDRPIQRAPIQVLHRHYGVHHRPLLLHGPGRHAFWKAVRFETHRPPHLEARLEVFRRLLPTSATKGTTEVFMFRDVSWFAVLLGMNFPFDPEPVDKSLLTAARLIRERKRESVRELAVKLPNHYRFLKETMYGRP